MVSLSREEWKLAEQVCTEKQLLVLDFARRGWGVRRIAAVLALDPSTVRYHRAAGLRNLDRALLR